MILPKISVIMPVLNRGDMIEKAICSVLDQQYPNLELIILDGGSKDNTLDVIKQYAEHIAYWHSQADGSASAATNIGITKASGDLIALLMSDDYYEPGVFHKIAENYLAYPEADIFTCTGRLVSLEGELIVNYTSRRELNLNFYQICYGATAICFRFIKKSLYARIGVYIPFHDDKKQLLTNDKEFLLRAVLHKAKNVHVDYLGYTHVAHAGSYSFGNHRSTFIRHCTEHMAIANQYLAKADLAFKYKVFLMIWYNDQSARLFVTQLLAGKFSDAGKTSWQGMKKFTLLWPVVGVLTVCRMMVKRVCRLG